MADEGIDQGHAQLFLFDIENCDSVGRHVRRDCRAAHSLVSSGLKKFVRKPVSQIDKEAGTVYFFVASSGWVTMLMFSTPAVLALSITLAMVPNGTSSSARR